MHARISDVLVEQLPGNGRRTARNPRASPAVGRRDRSRHRTLDQRRQAVGAQVGLRRSDRPARRSTCACAQRRRASTDRLRLELRVHLALGGIYAEHRAFSSAECGRAYTRALELCRELGDAPQIFAALSGHGIVRDHPRQSFTLARRSLRNACRLAGQQTSRPPFIMGHLLLGGTLFLGGHFTTARWHLEEAILLYEEDRSSRKGKQVLYVQDQKATGLCYLGLGLTIMGHLDAGLAAAREGVRHARALGAMHALNFSLCYLAGVHHFRREATEALECATQSLELSRELGFATWRGASQMVRGDAPDATWSRSTRASPRWRPASTRTAIWTPSATHLFCLRSRPRPPHDGATRRSARSRRRRARHQRAARRTVLPGRSCYVSRARRSP